MAVIETMGPAEVWVDATKVGNTKGGVNLKDDPEVNHAEEDGKGVVESYYGDEKITLEFDLTRLDADKLAELLPQATVDTYGNVKRGSAIGKQVPTKEITLKPLSDITDVTKQWKIYKGGAYTKLDLKFGKEQKVFKIFVQVYYSDADEGYYQIGLATA